ncbi:MAG: GNAT family N-acetyltransferase [Thiotrichales bacterium]
MSEHVIERLPYGGAEHQADIAAFRARGWPVPHPWLSAGADPPGHQRIWVRVAATAGWPRIAFPVELAPSRALPGTWIARIERIGRAPYAEAAAWLGPMLEQAARRIPRVQRLDVRIFDEDADRRQTLAASLFAAGARLVDRPRGYSHTLVQTIARDDAALLAAFSARTRRNLRKTLESGAIEVRPIEDDRYATRVEALHAASFVRTHARPPPLAVAAMTADARAGFSCLLGAFMPGRAPPMDLVAFAWGHLQGDHAAYDTAGSERCAGASGIAPGAALMWRLMLWARDRGAVWFDLGGIPPGGLAGDHPLRGIAEFKRGFATIEREIAVELALTPRTLIGQAVRMGRAIAPRTRTGT